MKTTRTFAVAAIGCSVLAIVATLYSRGAAAVANTGFDALLVPGTRVIVDSSESGVWLTVVDDVDFWADLEATTPTRGVVIDRQADHIRIQSIRDPDTLAPDGKVVLMHIPFRSIDVIRTYVEPPAD